MKDPVCPWRGGARAAALLGIDTYRTPVENRMEERASP